jgi:hypothetical protein
MKIAKAFFASMSAQLYLGAKDDAHLSRRLQVAGACSIDCTEDNCSAHHLLHTCMAKAIDHVDNGAELEATELYNQLGWLRDGKADRPDPLKMLMAALGLTGPGEGAEAARAIVVDIVGGDVPTRITIPDPEPEPGVPTPIGRMVGADRNRESDPSFH